MASPNYAQGQSVAGHSASPEDQYKYEDYQEPGESLPSASVREAYAHVRACSCESF